MKTSLALLALCLIVFAAPALAVDPPAPPKTDPPKTDAPKAESPTPPSTEFKTQKEKMGYILGYQQGGQMRRDEVEADVAAFARGMADAVAGMKPRLSDAEINAAVKIFQEELGVKQDKAQAEALAAAKKNEAAGEAYLAANKAKEGVRATASGLQYKVLREGSGAKPTANDTVTADYEGRLIDGAIFDSSYTRGKPANFPVGGVIKGWTEALQMMPVGSKWELYIPAKLAYGSASVGTIPPGSALIFTIELKATAPTPKEETPAPR